MDLLQIGEPGQGKKKIWIIARQHPGERPEAISCGLVMLDRGMQRLGRPALNESSPK